VTTFVGIAFDHHARVISDLRRLPVSALNSKALLLFGEPTSAMWKVSRIMAGELAGHARSHPGPQTGAGSCATAVYQRDMLPPSDIFRKVSLPKRSLAL
jgi:hypothetical protein